MSRCYLCLKSCRYEKSTLCTDCFCQLQEDRWNFCSRCGKEHCSGCQNLPLFHDVQSLFRYDGVLSKLLILCKENHNLHAQSVFEEFFTVPLYHALADFFSKKKYDAIVLSPLRQRRIAQGQWHPNVFFARVLQDWIKHHCKQSVTPQLLFPYYKGEKKKQSLLNRQERKNNSLQNLIVEYPQLTQEKLTSTENILLLDDVLTTGESAQVAVQLSIVNFPTSQWDLLTLLRTPF